MTDLTGLAWIFGVVGLAASLWIFVFVRRQPPGNEVMREFAGQIQAGARMFLRRQSIALAGFLVVAAALLWLLEGQWMAFAFVSGAVASMIAGVVGVVSATHAGVRTTEAARGSGAVQALRVAFGGASVAGLAVASLGLLGLGLGYFFAIYRVGYAVQEELLQFVELGAGFVLGASVAALFARLAGGVFTKAADIGADLVGKVESRIPEDDPRNPATVADNVGDCVGDTAGTGADLFESYVGALVAAMALGATNAFYASNRLEAVSLPLLLAVAGMVASLAGVGLTRALEKTGPKAAIRYAALGATAVFLLTAFVLVAGLGFDIQNEVTGESYERYGPFWAVLAGTGAGLLVALAAGYYTAGRPVGRIAEAARTGAATNIIAGLSLGMEAATIPLLVTALTVWVGYAAADLYGIGIAAVGMLSTVGMTMSMEAFSPIADNAAGISGMSGLAREPRQITRTLDTVGTGASAMVREFATGAAVVTAVALFAAYASMLGLRGINLIHPAVVAGVLIGGAIPFFVGALITRAVGRTAEGLVEEIRRQFREIKGLLEGTAKPDSARCVDLATREALREMVIPGAAAIAAPVLVGALMGPEALGGLVVGVIVAGGALGFFLANAGAALDSAKQRLQSEEHGTASPDAQLAVVIGDTVGDPFKDTTGPAMNVLVKLVAIISLALAPWFARLHGGEEGDQAQALIDAVGRVGARLWG
ncbi:MAG TPA: sodium-translocating pyrophosphatase [Longimicrobiaceae bacterium]|nr:sodium-translocating pyrophosphatase [Longimicrobiaceae bacterium]